MLIHYIKHCFYIQLGSCTFVAPTGDPSFFELNSIIYGIKKVLLKYRNESSAQNPFSCRLMLSLILAGQQHNHQQQGPTSSIFLWRPSGQRWWSACSLGAQFTRTLKVHDQHLRHTFALPFVAWCLQPSCVALLLSVSAGTDQRRLLSCLPAILQTRATSTTLSTPPPRTEPAIRVAVTNQTQLPAISTSLCEQLFALKTSGNPHQTVDMHLLVFEQRILYLNYNELTFCWSKGTNSAGKSLLDVNGQTLCSMILMKVKLRFRQCLKKKSNCPMNVDKQGNTLTIP